MKCPECSYTMDYVVLGKRGTVWICDRCGRMENDGTAYLDCPILTASTKINT